MSKFIKYADNHGWNFGLSKLETVVPYTKEASLRSASEAYEYACGLKPDPNKTNIVVIAMGTTDSYGPNRNADGFDRPMLKEYHPTFERYGHVFVNHKNKDPKKSYGEILRSFFNNDMDRVELVISLDNNKASKYVKRINEGRALPVSMGIHIPHDICNICGHKSPTIRHWCKHMKRRGDFGPNSIYYVDDDTKHEHPDKDGHLIFVHNPAGKFFDISMVTRPADQTAYMIYGPSAISGGDKRASYYENHYYDYSYGATTKVAAGALGKQFQETGNERSLATDFDEDTLGPAMPEKQGGQKLSDMVKKVEGLGYGLEHFKKDPKYLSDEKARKLARQGIHVLRDVVKRANLDINFVDLFKVAHMAMYDSLPSEGMLKKASENQRLFIEFLENNPALRTHMKIAFGLDERLEDSRSLRSIRENTNKYSSYVKTAEYAVTTEKEAAFCALLAADVLMDTAPSVEAICRGRAYGSGKIASFHPYLAAQIDVSPFDDCGIILHRAVNNFGSIIF